MKRGDVISVNKENNTVTIFCPAGHGRTEGRCIINKFKPQKHNNMPKYNPETREQEIELKDERTIFKTHNGFKCWMQYKKGEIIPVTEAYYLKAKKHRK